MRYQIEHYDDAAGTVERTGNYGSREEARAALVKISRGVLRRFDAGEFTNVLIDDGTGAERVTACKFAFEDVWRIVRD